MKRYILVTPLILVLALGTQGCDIKTVQGSGEVVEEERPVSGFTGVELAGIGTVYIELGDTEALRIEAENNLMEYLETEVQGGTLKIEQRDRVDLQPKEPINFYLTVKELDTIGISGSGEIRVPGLSVERFSVSVSGSGDVEVRGLDAGSLEVKISGSGDVDIAGGEVEEQDVTISGSGKYKAGEMESATAQVQVSGSGEATVRVRDHLEVDISGSGDVRYLGSPTLDTNISGSGEIERVGE